MFLYHTQRVLWIGLAAIVFGLQGQHLVQAQDTAPKPDTEPAAAEAESPTETPAPASEEATSKPESSAEESTPQAPPGTETASPETTGTETTPPESPSSETTSSEATDGETAGGETAGAETPPAETAADVPPPPADASTAAAAGDFAAQFAAWKEILRELREIRARYSIADDTEIEDLQKRWQEKLGQANGMIAGLATAGLEEFKKAPNANEELSDFLISMAADAIRRDDYTRAMALCQGLLEAKCSHKDLPNLAGIAAYGVNQFDVAEQQLAEAQKTGTLSQLGKVAQSGIKETVELWKAEAALREKEAAADDLPRVLLKTNAGDIVVELFENEAPETVGNFISLVEKGFYDDLTFHRVLEGFMAQTGCPNGNGSGGPGYSIYCECGQPNHRNHFAGSLSMAKEEAVNTGGSQFYITFLPTLHLNGKHTVFGRVVEGWDVLPKIVKKDPDKPDPEVEPTKILEAKVLRKRAHEYAPRKVN